MATMISPLRRATQVTADRTAVVCGGARLSYAEMAERCERLAGALRGLGVGAGDRVAIVSPNSHRYPEVYQAVPAAGMVLVPLNHRHTDAELRYALEDSGTKALFAGRPVADVPPCVEHVVEIGEPDEARPPAGVGSVRGTGRAVRGAARRGLAARLPGRGRGDRPRGPLLHRRDDRDGEGRDAHAPQPRRQRDAHADVLAVLARDRLARRGAAVPPGRLDRRAVDGVERRAPRDPAAVRPGRRPRPRRARARDRDPGRPEHARGDERGAARAPARRLLAAAPELRRRAERDRDAAPRPRGLPWRDAAASVRRD